MLQQIFALVWSNSEHSFSISNEEKETLPVVEKRVEPVKAIEMPPRESSVSTSIQRKETREELPIQAQNLSIPKSVSPYNASSSPPRSLSLPKKQNADSPKFTGQSTSTYKSQIVPSPEIQFTQTALSDFYECKKFIANEHLIRKRFGEENEAKTSKILRKEEESEPIVEKKKEIEVKCIQELPSPLPLKKKEIVTPMEEKKASLSSSASDSSVVYLI